MSRKRQGYLSILTGELGVLELKKLFIRWGWLPRPTLIFDQGVDLVVELGDGGRGLGLHFNVQSKATKGEVGGAADFVGVGLKASNVEYLLSQRFPVYLMFVNLPATEAYWIDAQAALHKTGRRSDGSAYIKVPRHRAIDLSLPDEQMPAERDRFIAALHESNPLLISPRMADVGRAIKTREEQLAALDPRFDVAITVRGESATYEISLREEVSLSTSISFSSAEDVERAKEVFDYGVSRTLSVESFQLHGSPLIDRLGPPARPGQLTIGGVADEVVDVYLGLRPSSGSNSIRKVTKLRGPLTRGARGFNISAAADDHPISCELRATPAEGQLQMTFQTSITAWKGKRIAELSGMADVAESLQAIVDSGELALGLQSRRFDPQFVHPLTAEMSTCLQAAADVLLQLDDLRDLALRYGRDLSVREPKAYLPNEPEWWRIGREILDGESVKAPSGVLTIRGEFEPGMEALIAAQTRSVFFVRNAPLAITVCGEVLCTIPVDAAIENYDVDVGKDSEGAQTLRMRRRSDSNLVLRRASDASFETLRGGLKR